MRVFLLAWAAAVAASPAVAGDRTGYQAIVAGNLQSAEQRLMAERRIYPDRPELMLNLAAIYGQSGRLDQARSLYAAVLDRPAVSMQMAGGGLASSHDIANRGLGRLTPALIATR